MGRRLTGAVPVAPTTLVVSYDGAGGTTAGAAPTDTVAGGYLAAGASETILGGRDVPGIPSSGRSSWYHRGSERTLGREPRGHRAGQLPRAE